MGLSLRPSTQKAYRGYINKKLKPYLGERKISKITTADIQTLYSKLGKEGSETGGKLSAATIQKIHEVLHQALDMAVSRRMIPQNPANDVTLPKRQVTAKTILNDEQLERFMTAIQADTLWYDFFYLEITTSLRRGELCGLMWTDFDELKGALNIRRTLHTKEGGGYYVGETKTWKGHGVIKLPPSTVELLIARNKHSIPQWILHNPFRPEDPIMPNSGYHRIKKLLVDAGLPQSSFPRPSPHLRYPRPDQWRRCQNTFRHSWSQQDLLHAGYLHPRNKRYAKASSGDRGRLYGKLYDKGLNLWQNERMGRELFAKEKMVVGKGGALSATMKTVKPKPKTCWQRPRPNVSKN